MDTNSTGVSASSGRIPVQCKAIVNGVQHKAMTTYPSGLCKIHGGAMMRAAVRTCYICHRVLDDPGDPIRSLDCGGDCRQCMVDCGDPDAIRSFREAGIPVSEGWPRNQNAHGAEGVDTPPPRG